jgi:hypothetical protein
MSIQLLVILAVVVMAALAALRLARVRAGRTPLPEGRGRRLFLVGFVILPPLALGAITQAAGSTSLLGGLGSLPAYVAILVVVVIVMWVAALIIARLTTDRWGQLARLALVGGEADPVDSRDTPITVGLSQSVGLVTKANAAFPRGPGFAGQIERTSFRADWDALDGATRKLEGQIAEDHRLGLGVAAAATSLAEDARSRLDTLRRFASDHGQGWATATASATAA